MDFDELEHLPPEVWQTKQLEKSHSKVRLTWGSRSAKEQVELKAKAEELEKARDEKSRETESLMAKHHTFSYCVTFAQVAIALSAIAALTRRRAMWFLSLGVGLIGLVLLLNGFLKT